MDSAEPLLRYLEAYLPVYERWTGEPGDRRHDIAGRLTAVAAAAQPGPATDGAAALRAAATTLSGSVGMLHHERNQLAATWAGAAGEGFGSRLDEVLARGVALDADVAAVAAVAQRHADAVREVIDTLDRALLALAVPVPGLTPAGLHALVDRASSWPGDADPQAGEQARDLLDQQFLPGVETLLDGFDAAVGPAAADAAELWDSLRDFVADLDGGSVVLADPDSVVPKGPGPVTLGTVPDPVPPG